MFAFTMRRNEREKKMMEQQQQHKQDPHQSRDTKKKDRMSIDQGGSSLTPEAALGVSGTEGVISVNRNASKHRASVDVGTLAQLKHRTSRAKSVAQANSTTALPSLSTPTHQSPPNTKMATLASAVASSRADGSPKHTKKAPNTPAAPVVTPVTTETKNMSISLSLIKLNKTRRESLKTEADTAGTGTSLKQLNAALAQKMMPKIEHRTNEDN